MEKFVPYVKSSKKQRKILDDKARESWDEVKPYTRVFRERKKYYRKQKHPQGLDMEGEE